MPNDKLPELSHLQFAVLDVLGTAKMTGKQLRAGLKEIGISKSGPTFYQAMARMEEAKLVEGWYNQSVIDGQLIKEREYRITGAGLKALNETKRFYENRTTPLGWNPKPLFI
jgi:DNA-binding PadR family transcriptional regulator